MKTGYWKHIISFITVLLGFSQVDGQEAIYNSFLIDSIGVGGNVDLYITVEQAQFPDVNNISLKDISNMKFYPPVTQPGDSIVSKTADISINSLGLWEDLDNNGILNGAEIKWEKQQSGDTILYRNKLNLSFFDVGLYIFEGFSLSNNGQQIKTNSSMLKVNFQDYDLEFVDSTGLAPIKDIQREYIGLRDILPYLIFLLIAIAIIFGIYRFLKFKKEKALGPVEIEEIIIPPDVLALTGLKDLRSKELWQSGQIKEYQSQLSHIVREYLEGRYEIKALENTTSQIIRSITDKSFEKEDQEKLKRILQISDLVKFAKAKPNVNIHEEFMDDAISFVQKTRNELRSENKEEE